MPWLIWGSILLLKEVMRTQQVWTPVLSLCSMQKEIGSVSFTLGDTFQETPILHPLRIPIRKFLLQ